MFVHKVTLGSYVWMIYNRGQTFEALLLVNKQATIFEIPSSLRRLNVVFWFMNSSLVIATSKINIAQMEEGGGEGEVTVVEFRRET